jgi:hypothetical protein
MILRFLLPALLAAGLLAACSGVETIPDDTSAFTAKGFSRYAWRSEPLSQERSRDRLAQVDPIIRSSVDERLAELGYALVEREQADFLVEYIAAASINAGRLPTTASNVTPYPSAQINRQADGATVDNAYALGGMKEMGNLLLVFVEPTATQLLWRVRISKVIEDANRVNEKAVRRAVRQGLATLPEAP